MHIKIGRIVAFWLETEDRRRRSRRSTKSHPHTYCETFDRGFIQHRRDRDFKSRCSVQEICNYHGIEGIATDIEKVVAYSNSLSSQGFRHYSDEFEFYAVSRSSVTRGCQRLLRSGKTHAVDFSTDGQGKSVSPYKRGRNHVVRKSGFECAT